ncbi:Sodium:neurotransmitter symporter family protein [Teladorsagia circumcincta]|uniref:Sodium:neurotransmitter symporter family protein n=1 Tax=Teladorsagia circumcincta TaxID=45464 RepID=A0A2G9UT87_TELCI|nr:Sodium:neurotransmitter symporter family protein [Teladorsagia circumcincta]
MGDALPIVEATLVARKPSRGLGTAAEYQPLASTVKPATLAVRESDSIEPLGGLSPKVESRVSALRRRSSVARDRWATKMEFLLAVIGYAVDLGNIWRFPSVCYKHGGGAFLIPYLVMLLIGGLPMFYMELALGQFHRSGCMVWVTATAPYIVLTILLIRGVTLPGAAKGIYYYLTPDFSKLNDPKVWSAAASQIFFSLGPGFGVLLALSSYNDFNNNCYRTSAISKFHDLIDDCFEVVGDHDASLIFIVYPQALATMSYSSAWSFIFFVMLITLGIDSTFAGIEALITGLCDESRLLSRNRELFVGVVCVLYYFGSLPAISYGGQYVIPFLDEYGVSLSVLFIVTCEMVAVCWFYGIDRFSNDIK